MIKSILNSRSIRSLMTSRCSKPRKPHRKPNPKANEVSVSKVNDESFNANFSIDSLSFQIRNCQQGKSRKIQQVLLLITSKRFIQVLPQAL